MIRASVSKGLFVRVNVGDCAQHESDLAAFTKYICCISVKRLPQRLRKRIDTIVIFPFAHPVSVCFETFNEMTYRLIMNQKRFNQFAFLIFAESLSKIGIRN